MKTVLVSKFDLSGDDSDSFRQISMSFATKRGLAKVIELVRSIKYALVVDAIFVSNPQVSELLFCRCARAVRASTLRIVYFDLILRRPVSPFELLLSRVKSLLLRAADEFLCIHRDVSGYQRFFGVDPLRCRYVPFKPNNYDLIGKVRERDEGYIVALGASHRDYDVLVAAVAGTAFRTVIVAPAAAASEAHNTSFRTGSLPSNVEHISDSVDRQRWNELIAAASVVVVPILQGTLQPAGISVYLEAMALGKPVVVTEGSSTRGLLTDDIAVCVPPGDSASMRAALESLMNDQGKRLELGCQARKYAQSLMGHDRLVSDLRQCVTEALQGE